MDNEKYGIELDLIWDKFKEKMQQVKSSITGIKDTKMNLNANTAQIEYLKKQIGELTADLQVNEKTHFWNETETLKAEAELERLKNKLTGLTSATNSLNTNNSNYMSNMSKGFEKISSKIKRFGLSLLSIRTIYSLVSRASSAYLSQDTDLANRLQSVWAGLGAMLAPIIEGIVGILERAVKYINIFVKALTGVDLLAKATSKSMKGTAKSAKALNKALAGFDELTNLDTEAGGGDIAGGLSGLNDVKIDTKWADRIENFGKWCKDNLPIITSLFGGIVGAIIAIKLGLYGIKALGIGVAVAGIVYAISSLIEYLKDSSWENFGKIIQGIGIAIIGFGIIIGSIPAIVVGVVVLIVGTIVKYWEQIKEFLQNGIDWLVSKTDWVRDNFGILGEFIYKTFTDVLQLVLNIFDNIFTTIKGVFDGIIKFIKGVFTGDWKLAWEGIKQIFSSIWEGIKGIVLSVWNFIKNLVVNIAQTTGEIISNVFKTVVNGVLGAIEKILNAPIRAVNSLINVINEVPGINLGRLSTFNLPRLNVGTNYVPQDQLAMIHKGEAVIPKKFNSEEYFGGANEDTLSKLDKVIEVIEGINFNPYITVKDVGKASLNYINNKSRQLGESVVV